MHATDLAYGTQHHRREPHPASRHEARCCETMEEGVMEIGKMAVGSMVTVGVIGALGSAFHKD